MFDNITIGQYYPTDSIIHKLDPRIKIAFTLVYIVMLFVIDNIWGYLFAFIILFSLIYASKIPVKYLFKGIKAIIFIIIITVALNMFLTPGEVIFKFYFVQITLQGVEMAVKMAVRLVFLVVGTSLLTLTTSPIDLTDGLEFYFRHIPFLKKYAHELSMMMSIALRFIPTLMDETSKIMKAQKARGAQFDTGNLIDRAKAMVMILVPLFVSAFRRADELATAMEARCYRGGVGRTKMKQMILTRDDKYAIVLTILMIIILWGSRYIPIPVF